MFHLEVNMPQSSYDPDSLQDVLPIYYKRLFPYSLYTKWLSYGDVQKDYLANREFSFMIGDDIYLRYQSYSTQEELEKAIQQKCPHKIDIGAVYNNKPKDHLGKQLGFQPMEKELVFDIDMTDYDDVRTCCSGADICEKCWKFMVIAVKILDRALREDFGWEHLLWVFSGRRGIHCWVCDPSARKLDSLCRSAVVEYLTIIRGGDNKNKKVTLPLGSLHPMTKKAVNVIDSYFEKVCLSEQDILGTEQLYKKVVGAIPDDKLRQSIVEDLQKCQTSKERWDKIESWIYTKRKEKFSKVSPHLEDEIKLQHMYPRLDVNVTKGVNHLLKSPFCIHPKTGKVCVPIDPSHIDNFDPMNVPTISQLINELDANKDDDKDSSKSYKNTSLSSSIQVFSNFIRKMEKLWKEDRLQQSDSKMEF